VDSFSRCFTTDSGKIQKSVQLETRIGVQIASEHVFRLGQNMQFKGLPVMGKPFFINHLQGNAY